MRFLEKHARIVCGAGRLVSDYGTLGVCLFRCFSLRARGCIYFNFFVFFGVPKALWLRVVLRCGVCVCAVIAN